MPFCFPKKVCLFLRLTPAPTAENKGYFVWVFIDLNQKELEKYDLGTTLLRKAGKQSTEGRFEAVGTFTLVTHFDVPWVQQLGEPVMLSDDFLAQLVGYMNAIRVVKLFLFHLPPLRISVVLRGNRKGRLKFDLFRAFVATGLNQKLM